MNITRTFYTANRKAWREWLKKHYKTAKEIWLIYYRKESGKPRIAYGDAVEEALCFGWIDSTVRKLDEERFAQRFSPRNPRSPYSQPNLERLRRLLAQRKVCKEVRDVLPDLRFESFKIPSDIERALKKNTKVWESFQKFPDSYRRIRIAYVEGVRERPEEFKKRLRYLVKMTEQNKRFGFGIDRFIE